MVKFPYKVVTVLGDGFGCSLLTMSGVSSPNFITGNVGTGQCPFRGGEILFRLGGCFFFSFSRKFLLFLISVCFLLFQQGVY